MEEHEEKLRSMGVMSRFAISTLGKTKEELIEGQRSGARGLQAALKGCRERGADDSVMEGVLAVFLDNLDALTDFQHKLKTFLGHGT
jgi:hypothetical protein